MAWLFQDGQELEAARADWVHEALFAFFPVERRRRRRRQRQRQRLLLFACWVFAAVGGRWAVGSEQWAADSGRLGERGAHEKRFLPQSGFKHDVLRNQCQQEVFSMDQGVVQGGRMGG